MSAIESILQNMPRYEPIVPDGQHLGTSHDVDGAVTGHLFSDGDNKLQGHAAWREVEDPEDDYSSDSHYEAPPPLTQEELERAAELAALIIVVLVKGVQWASPRIKNWWDATAAPNIKSTWQRLRGRSKKEAGPIDLGHLNATRSTFVASSAGVELVATSKIRMSTAEWEQRLRAMIAAASFQDEQRRILSNAQIDDDDRALEAGLAQEELTPQQFAGRIQAMLEANPSLLSGDNAEELMRVLRQARHRDDDGDLALSI